MRNDTKESNYLLAKQNNLETSIFIEDIDTTIRQASIALLDKLSDLKHREKSQEMGRELKELYQSCHGFINLFSTTLKLLPNFQVNNTIKETFNLSELVQECIKLIAPYKTEHHLQLIVNIAKELPQQYAGDKSRITLTFLTLLTTLILNTYHGKIIINIKSRACFEKQINLKIEVISLCSEIAENFFEQAYQRINHVLTSNHIVSSNDFEHLNTAKKLAQQLNSTITISTVSNHQGLQFSWDLPLMICQDEKN